MRVARADPRVQRDVVREDDLLEAQRLEDLLHGDALHRAQHVRGLRAEEPLALRGPLLEPFP